MSTASVDRTYTYDQSWTHERRRLALIEQLWDHRTTGTLDRLGVLPGWRCVDVGAGGGSIARWLRDRVGPEGHVVAADLDTRYVEGEVGIEARSIDILTDDLEVGAYDLVHCRLLLHHLPGRELAAVERMARALRPGGLLVVTEPYLGAMFGTATPELASMWQAFDAATPSADFRWAPKLLPTLVAAGLTDVDASAAADVVRGATDLAEVLALTVEAVRGRVTDEPGVDAGLRILADPKTLEAGLVWYCAWGRKEGNR